jgi:hypothetical protein
LKPRSTAKANVAERNSSSRVIAETKVPMLPTGKVDRQALVALLTAD